MKPWQIIERRDNEVISFAVRFIDVLAFLIGGYISFIFRNWLVSVDESLYFFANIIGALLVIIVFPIAGVYRTQRGQSWFAQLQKIIIAWASVFLILITIAFITKTSTSYSRIWVVSWASNSLLFLVTFRLILTKVINLTRKKGWNRKKIIIVGAGESGKSVLKKIRETQWAGIDVIGFLDNDLALKGKIIDGVVVKGGLNSIGDIVNELIPDEIWVTISLKDEELLGKLLHELRHTTITTRYIPNVFSYRLMNHSISEIAGLPVINLNETPLYGINHLIKSMEDRILALIILLLVCPVFVLIAIAIRLTSPGPVFYKQERISWNGKQFTMLKFRTMPVDVENESGPVWAKVNESRATKVGAFLRRTSLDELPQFINVLKGDMSIVGPRPERPFFVEKFKEEIPSYMKKHMVKAGITGWAQVNGWRGDTDLSKRIEYDLYYIENWSLWFDLKIILMTLFKGFASKNAY